jgi:chromate transporter
LNFNCFGGRDRTRDHKVKSLVLYQLSYRLDSKCLPDNLLLYTEFMSGTERADNAAPNFEQHDPSLPEFTGVIFRAANFTVGGGGPAIAMLLREMVYKRRWMSEEGYAMCYALARVTPGTNMIAFYTATGWLLKRWRGAIAAMIAGSLPCCVFAALVTAGFERVNGNRWVQGAMDSALAASVGLLLATFWLLVKPFLKRRDWKSGSAIVTASIVLSIYVGLSPVTVLILAALAGALFKPGPEEPTV